MVTALVPEGREMVAGGETTGIRYPTTLGTLEG